VLCDPTRCCKDIIFRTLAQVGSRQRETRSIVTQAGAALLIRAVFWIAGLKYSVRNKDAALSELQRGFRGSFFFFRVRDDDYASQYVNLPSTRSDSTRSIFLERYGRR